MFRREFISGFRSGLPVVLAAAPFGMLFGALAVENGLTVAEAVLMSATIYAGASQMVGIELFGADIAPWLIVFSIFAVNFRHLLYSAAVGPHLKFSGLGAQAAAFFLLIDPQYAETERRLEKGEPVTSGWYFGMGITVYVTWVAEAWIGASFGNLIENPARFGIDFFLPLYFLGLVMGFRKRARWLPTVLISGIVAYLAFLTLGSPWHVSIGAVAGIAMAAALAKPDQKPDQKPVQSIAP